MTDAQPVDPENRALKARVRILEESNRVASQNELRYRTLFEAAPEAITIYDTAVRRFVDVNEQAARLFGMTREELLRIGPRELTPELQPDGTPSEVVGRRFRLEALAGGAPTFEWTHRRADGTLFPCEIRLVSMGAVAPELLRGSIFDITERKRREREEEQRRKELLRADRMLSLGTLLSGIAHEINNPNHFIMLNVPFLRDVWRDASPVLQEHAREHPQFRLANVPWEEISTELPELIDEIHNGAERIRRIVSELREYTRNPQSMEKSAASLNEAVNSALTLLASPIRKATNHFAVHLHEGLPAVWADVRGIEQIVINLLLNACEALTSPAQRIEVSTSLDGESVLLEVTDEGRGMSEKELAQIFDPFYTTRRQEGGTGLGMAVSARIVEDAGGKLSYRSEVGAGTTARLSLPVHRDAEP